MPVILATQEAKIKRIMVQNQHEEIVQRLYLENTQPQKGLTSDSSGRVPA
jgi:hypothetical protein